MPTNKRSRVLAPPQAGVLIRIKSAAETFKPAERQVADFVIRDPEKIVQMSISELARDAKVGESTIIRFCRALAYSGYQEFKLRLAQDLVQPVEYIHENISFEDDTRALTQKIFQTNLEAVQSTMRALDPSMVEVAANYIAKADRIDIYGVAYSYSSAADAKLKFRRFGLNADAFCDSHLQLMAAASLSRKSVALGISHSGSTKEVIDALALARRSGARTICITNFSPSPITKVSDVVLLTASPQTPLGGEVLTSGIAQLCVIDVLSVVVAVVLGERCLDLISKTSEAVKTKRC
ncbi:MAG: MurR/RpiR family transcriptional regulator [Acidobacteriota bacterium]